MQDLETITLTAAGLGRALGITARRVRELREQGRIPSLPDGQYDLFAAAPAYCALLRPASGRGAVSGSAEAGELDSARIRLVTAQAQARELLNDQLRGEAVLTEDIEMVVGATFEAVRAKLLSVPVVAAARVVGMADRAGIQEQLMTLISNALADLATPEIVGSVKGRARHRGAQLPVDAED